MNPKKPIFIISLDFELYWGMIDKVSLAEYEDRLLGVRSAIPEILGLFEEYGLHATWATLGMLMHETKESLIEALPIDHLRPVYRNTTLSTYDHIIYSGVGESERTDPCHFGASLVQKIQKVPGQEIASHTFSHYYCIDGMENSEDTFDADCKAFTETAAQYKVKPRSIVFPRNQVSEEALKIAKRNGISAYRGNEDHFLYKSRSEEEQKHYVRALRLLDHYISISGHHSYMLVNTDSEPIANIPASRFLRPYSKPLRFFESLRMRRIKKSMTHAAKRGEVFHLWWHPHNFGQDLTENMKNLRNLAEHFKALEEEYGMQSLTMAEAADLKRM